MGKLSWQNWRNKMEQLIKEQGSRLELLEATVKEQKVRLDKLESSPIHPSRQPNNISEIRDALVRVLRVPRKVPENTSAPGNEEVDDLPPADSNQQSTAPEVVTNPEKITSSRTGTAEVFGKGYSEVRVKLVRLGIHKGAAECVSSSEHKMTTIPLPTSSRQDNDTSTEVVTTPRRNNISSTERLRGETPKSATTQTVYVPRARWGNPKSAVERSSEVDHRRSVKSKNSANQIKSSSAGERNSIANLDSDSQIKNNSGRERFKCSICAKTFPIKYSLTKHMRVHTGEKPFSCKVCRKQFTQSGSIKIHMRIHTGEKPFVCEFCRRAFNHGSHLNQHLRMHTGEKPYRCNFCNAMFTHSASLAGHIRDHTKERPYVCEECGANFKWPRNLITHKKMHAPANLSLP